MSSCVIKAHTKNAKGEIVESKLWNDLTDFLKERELVKQNYAVASNATFRDKVKNKATFDENGEITFDSYQKVTHLNINEEQILSDLNNKISKVHTDFQTAIRSITAFNKKPQYGNKYMATINDLGQGKYQVKVVERNKKNEAELQSTIENTTFLERLQYKLAQHGIAVDFKEIDVQTKGRFSTKDASLTAEGLYTLISVAHNKPDISRTLAEEAGHFVIASFGNDPIVTRLLNLITPSVQHAIYGKYYVDKDFGYDDKRETAGVLVGDALIDVIGDSTPWERLAHRIAQKAKKLWATITSDTITKAKLEAQEIAEDIANDFWKIQSEGTVENALETEETLFDRITTIESKTYQGILHKLKHSIDSLNAIGDSIFKNSLKSTLKETLTQEAFSDLSEEVAAVNGGIQVMRSYLSLSAHIPSLLANINLNDAANWENYWITYMKTLHTVQQFLSDAYSILSALQNMKSIISNHKEKATYEWIGDLNSVINDSEQALNILLNDFQSVQLRAFTKFCETMLGRKYIRKAGHIVWNLGKNRIKNPAGKTRWTRMEEARTITIEDAVLFLEKDDSWISKLLYSAGNSQDLVVQAADNILKRCQKQVINYSNEAQDFLRVSKEKLNKIGISTRSLYETREDNSLTGNIISEYNWGKYEDEYNEFYKQQKELWLQESGDNLKQLTDLQRGLAWSLYIHPKVKQWHKTHSVFDKSIRKYRPNDSYKNEKFAELSQKEGFLDWYTDFMSFLHQLHALLPANAVSPVRAPQQKATFINKMKNRRKEGYFTGHALNSSILSSIQETFCDDAEDIQFGDDNTYEAGEDPFSNVYEEELEKVRKVPMFGVRKLKNMQDLSTDLFHSTLSFAVMAYHYATINTVSDALILGSDVLLRRQIGNTRSITTEEGLGTYQTSLNTTNRTGGGQHSNSYQKYTHLLDKEVYNIYSSKHYIGRLVFEKTMQFITKIGTFKYLAGNVKGGLINTGTGIFELLKEAMSQENFTLSDFLKAHSTYFKSMPENWIEYAEEMKQSKVDLFIRHFGLSNEGIAQYRNWHTEGQRRFINGVSRLTYLPYRSGDHYMHTITYLMLANNTFLYDGEGKKYKLYDIYEKVDNTQNGITKGSTLKQKKGTFYKTRSARIDKDAFEKLLNVLQRHREEIKDMDLKEFTIFVSGLQEINELLSKWHPSTISEYDGKQYKDAVINALNRYNVNVYNDALESGKEGHINITKLIDDVQHIIDHDLIWSEESEEEFTNKGREINIRMHGIYNQSDGVELQRCWYGAMLLSMKGYALGMFERRFRESHYNLSLDKEVEGSLNTFAKMLATWGQLGLKNGLTGVFLPYTKGFKQAMREAGFSNHQIANVKRTFADHLVILLLTLCRYVALPPIDDDPVAALLEYLTHRWLKDESEFNMPSRLLNIIDVVPVGAKALQDIQQIIQYGIQSNISPDYYKKFEDRVKKSIPYYKDYYILQDPKKAIKNYEFGLNAKKR